MIDHYYAVIMAGGGGTRLWPLSRRENPKQLLDLSGSGRSLIQTAVDRLEGLFPVERILIVTTSQLAEKIKQQIPGIPERNYLIEPMPKGTASVVGLAAAALKAIDPHADTSMAILTADHFIDKTENFRSVLAGAYQAALDDYLVTLGIQPTFPSTGYGYIQKGEKTSDYLGFNAHRVVRFVEKPDDENARKMLETDAYLWNSGMFIWKVSVILKAMEKWMPDLAQKIHTIQEVWQKETPREVIENIWPTIIPQTIDYGIMEKAERVVVLPAEDLGWNDVGSWESLFDVLPADENGNIIIASKYSGLSTTGTLVYAGATNRLITTIGLNNMIIVDTQDALLVCSRNDTQNVKKLLENLKQMDRGEFL